VAASNSQLWPKWSIATSEPGDFLPIVIGGIFLFMSLPGFVMLLVNADRASGAIALPLPVVLGAGIMLGMGFYRVRYSHLLLSGITRLTDNAWPNILAVMIDRAAAPARSPPRLAIRLRRSDAVAAMAALSIKTTARRGR